MGDDTARQVIKAAREWQGNAELAIAPEIVEDLITELELRLPATTAKDDSYGVNVAKVAEG